MSAPNRVLLRLMTVTLVFVSSTVAWGQVPEASPAPPSAEGPASVQAPPSAEAPRVEPAPSSAEAPRVEPAPSSAEAPRVEPAAPPSAQAIASAPAGGSGANGPHVRLVLRGGASWAEGDAWQPVADSRVMGGGELLADILPLERLLVGVALGGRSLGGTTYDTVDSSLGGVALRVSAGARWQLADQLDAYVRGGAVAWWWTLTYDPQIGGEAVTAKTFSPGLFAGAGLNLWFTSSDPAPAGGSSDDVLFGANAELTYDRCMPAEFKRNGRAMGTIDASGPGFLLGAVLQF